MKIQKLNLITVNILSTKDRNFCVATMSVKHKSSAGSLETVSRPLKRRRLEPQILDIDVGPLSANERPVSGSRDHSRPIRGQILDIDVGPLVRARNTAYLR